MFLLLISAILATVGPLLFAILISLCVATLIAHKMTSRFHRPGSGLAFGLEMAGGCYPKILGDGKPRDKKPKPKEKNFNPMALVKYAGNGAMAISGKIGGTVFTIGGQQGAFIRNWAKPRNRRTALQNFVRGVLSGIATSWRTLTTAQADAWNAAAAGPPVSGYNVRNNRFGDVRKLSGSQMYQRINNDILIAGGTPYASPPVSGATDAILAIVSIADESAQTFLSTLTTFGGATAVPANTNLIVYATPQKGANQSYFSESDYRLLTVLAAASAINPAVLTTAYLAAFGALVAGAKIGLKMHFQFDDGAGTFSRGGDVYETVVVVP